MPSLPRQGSQLNLRKDAGWLFPCDSLLLEVKTSSSAPLSFSNLSSIILVFQVWRNSTSCVLRSSLSLLCQHSNLAMAHDESDSPIEFTILWFNIQCLMCKFDFVEDEKIVARKCSLSTVDASADWDTQISIKTASPRSLFSTGSVGNTVSRERLNLTGAIPGAFAGLTNGWDIVCILNATGGAPLQLSSRGVMRCHYADLRLQPATRDAEPVILSIFCPLSCCTMKAGRDSSPVRSGG